MHGVELLAVGVETDDAVAAIEVFHIAHDLPLLRVEPSVQTIETDIDGDLAEVVFRVGEHLLDDAQRVEASGRGAAPVLRRSRKRRSASRRDWRAGSSGRKNRRLRER